MYKAKTMAGLVFVILILVVSGIFIATGQEQETTKGANYETVCENEICTTTLYSYEKYWNNGDEWEEIDENFYVCTERNAEYCTKEYHFRVFAEDNGLVSSVVRDTEEELGIRLRQFRNQNLTYSPTIEGSVITYEDILPNIDLRYQFLPTKVKEDIILKERLRDVESDFQVLFDKTGNADFVLVEPIVCDAVGVCIKMNYETANDEISLTIPADFLNHPNVTYPVYIDPTIELNDSFIAWNGRILYDGTGIDPYTRVNNPTTLPIGLMAPYGANAVAGIDWNVSTIPDEMEITNATLQLYVEDSSSPSNYLDIRHMEGSSFTWSDDNTGNYNFYSDMRNGTVYKHVSAVDSNNFYQINLGENGTIDIENSLSGDLFSIGIDTNTVNKDATISARDNSNATRRPTLTITYGVNSSDGDDAIIEGIGNSLPGNPISSSQKVYLVNENSNHYTGTFDKATTYLNQSWAFNYVDSGDSYINMPSLFFALNVWENDSLTYEEIVSQVELFINDTVY